jgi:nitrate/TMAO reductase-like tetraheme cytochrome c subunit
MTEAMPEKSVVRKLPGRRSVRALLVALALAVPAAAFAGARGWRYMKTNPDFCVSCHLMEGPAAAWRRSAHKAIACQTCHRADIFEEMRLGFAAFVERREEIGRHTKLDTIVCGECHASNDARWKQIAGTPGHKTHVGQRDISCLVCHATKVHDFAADTSRCVRCHGSDHLRLAKMEDLHCLGCHDFAGKRWSTLLPAREHCRECHPEPAAARRAAIVENGKTVGKAVHVQKGHGNCLGCHRPHGKPLDDPIDCLSCHRTMLDAGSKHYRDERLTSCRECHEPHETE